MDLNKILPRKDKQRHDYYWSIAIEPEWAQVSLWYTVGDTAHILAFSTPTAWSSEKELIDAIDAALTYVVQNTNEDIGEPSKTVFGVIDSWVKNGQIEPDHLDKIKKICHELSLTPVGFVVISEAIANYIKSSEGSPFTGVILGLSKEFLNITLFSSGSVNGHTQVARSLSVVDDMVEGLTRINTGGETPSRFVIYNAKKDEIEEAKQSLIKANWEDYQTLKFLHTPKIEVVEVDKKIEAVSLGGASDISKATKVIGPGGLQSVNVSDNFEINEQTQKVSDSIQSADITDPEDLGFAVGKDVAQEPIEAPQSIQHPEPLPNHPENIVSDGMEVKQRRLPISFAFVGSFLSRFKSSSGGGGVVKKVLIIGIGLLLIIIIAGFTAWWFLPEATVTLYLSTQNLDEKINVTVDPDRDSADFENKILPAVVLGKDVEGSKTKSTTGTKTVGERAIGEVTLYRVGTSVVLDQGTELGGPDGLKFNLDEEIEVASGSASTPGTTKAKVTAADIGADHNLASGATFSVANFALSTVEAKNESSFSGGSSSEINAVSEEDQESLFDDLGQELKEKAIEELSDELVSSLDCSQCRLVPESYTLVESDSEYSAKVGDEADSLGLDLTQKTQTVALREEDLVELARGVLETRIPEGYVLRDDQIDTSFEFESSKDGKYEFTISVTANLFPEIDPAVIAEKIAGKYPDLAKDYFTREIPSFVRAEISMRPKLPTRLYTLPHVDKNIEVIITSEGQ